MSVTNCRRCGALIPARGRRLCLACLEAEESEYRRVRDYVREHPEAPVMQVSRETGVTVARIYDWVRQGKLVAVSPESDLAVECAGCGTRIVSGRLCEKCRARLRRDDAKPGGRLTGRVHLRERLQREPNRG